MDPRYPIGQFKATGPLTPETRAGLTDKIEAFPGKLRALVEKLSEEQLDTRYRDGGWTVRQVVHHLPDSHLNSYVRFKLALTEDDPTIRPYDEALWAELADARTAPIELSLRLLEALHERWTWWLRSVEGEEWSRTFRHPETGTLSLDVNLRYYAWHCSHHFAHISNLVKREGWLQGQDAAS